jgi:hypothetical protein
MHTGHRTAAFFFLLYGLRPPVTCSYMSYFAFVFHSVRRRQVREKVTGVADYDATSASHFTNNHPCLLTRDYSQYRVISTARQTITGKSSACALLVFFLFTLALLRRSLFLGR